MDLQNVLPAEIICQGKILFSREKDSLLTATADLVGKCYITAIIPEKQLSQNYVNGLFPLEIE
jgi:hypothetical protein